MKKFLDVRRILAEVFSEGINMIPSHVRKSEKKFFSIMEIAHDISRNEPLALVDLVRLVGCSIQSDVMTASVKSNESRRTEFTIQGVWFDPWALLTLDGRSIAELKLEVTTDVRLKLSEHLLFPSPWCRQRIVKNLCDIGLSKKQGNWQQQEFNHDVEYWLPLGIGWVIRGHHSIMSGIVQRQGEIVPRNVYDISPIYDHVVCDGKVFRRKHDDHVISKVTNVEMAAIFEIGRLMIEKGVSA